MAVTKKTRFEVFKRDSFTCQYCGSHPPAVILEVDHVLPKFKKGTDIIDNLITSCFSCNRGKGKNELTNIPESLSVKMELLKEKELQIKEYSKLIKSIEKRILKECDQVNDIYNSYCEGWYLSDKFVNSSLKMFISKLGVVEVSEAMHKAGSRPKLNENAIIKYFCGICWNKIKGE